MYPDSSGAGELERRNSTRNSFGLSLDDGDVEHDFLVADGFRPIRPDAQMESSTLTPSASSFSSGASTLVGDDSSDAPSMAGRPLSPSKPHTPQFALVLRLEPSGLRRHATDSTRSTASTAYIPADTPYRGPTRPSHPYEMYPQNVKLARTLSVRTSSTALSSESSYAGPMAPSHPSGLYLQSDGAGPDAVQAATIPLGFRGLPDQYQRQLGPDGEDVGDMIGPDGHTERLPPYTRYPDEAHVSESRATDGPPGAVRGGSTISSAASSVPSPTIANVPGAGGMGMATRNPAFESTDDLHLQRSHSSRSYTSDDTQRCIKLYDGGMSEKGMPVGKWETWLRRRLCGVIPYRAIILTIVALVVMASISGAVIGTFVARQNKSSHEDVPSEPTFEAIPIPTPSDLAALPLGTYGMPLTSMSTRVSSTCFQDPALSRAWNCHPAISSLQLTVSKTNADYGVTLDCNQSLTLQNNVYSWGQQPPLIPKPVGLQLVRDMFEPSRGPAWFTLLSYNKTVIIPESWLGSAGSTSSPQQKARRAVTLGSGMPTRKGLAQRGDKAWICNWPETYLELFIYAQQNSNPPDWKQPPPIFSSPTPTPSSSSSAPSSPSSSASSLPPFTSPPPNSIPAPITINGAYQSYTGGSYPPGGEGASGGVGFGGQELAATATSSPRGSGSGSAGFGGQELDATAASSPRGSGSGNAGLSGQELDATPTSGPRGYWPPPQNLAQQHTGPPPDGSFAAAAATTTASASLDPNPAPPATPPAPWGPIDTADSHVPPYPRALKLEERRAPPAGAPLPRCTQVEIQGVNEEAKAVVDDAGSPVVVDILETEPRAGAPVDGAGSRRRARWDRAQRHSPLVARDDVPDISPCGCMWYLT
ncbi:hypothetical protein BT67DRAFT_284335 [Trichocladium antarcticum]|uniref:DUF7820 domain-containing protein n=1 Tax=Trichocladium antarcticum TaxID=1450529 RepID=A0AAN6ZE08_9PEZI|nr:hypothetical protein BT67DRAFT_284335 [Trichocladium antarcticum]